MQPDFAIGQRWLSDTESELGLGVVVDVDDRCVHILFPQSDETRVYSRKTAPLSRVVFKENDWLTDQDGKKHRVTQVDDIMGVFRYTCEGLEKPMMETRLAANIQLAKPLDRLLATRIENNEWYRLRIETLLMRAELSTSPLRGMLGARVGLIPHQLYIAHEVGKRLAPRVLLADEVGLGKTIEAGLIIHQQVQTGRSERVLVLVPDSLQYQWMIEMRRRFNLNFALFDLVRTAAIKEHDPEANPFLTEQLIICSIDLLLDHDDLAMQALYAGFDLLVVDEAHHLHWHESDATPESNENKKPQGEGNDSYRLVEDFAKSTAGVLLLTATPEQLGIDSHFARLRLLDPERFNSLDDFVAGEAEFSQIAQVAEVLLGDDALSEKQLATLGSMLARAEDDPVVDNEQGRQQAVNQLLDRHGTGRVLFRNTRDAITGFLGRCCHEYPLPLPESWQNTPSTTGKLREQLWPEEQQPDGSWLEADPRVPWLIKLLQQDLKNHKVLLIARSGTVVESLEAALRLHAGIKTAMFNEQMTLLERDQAAAYFTDEFGAQILLCSEVGSEGRNFQFAHHLVLFDLPANPDTLEQRIGRLDRIGQTQLINIHVPYITDTAQERMFRWYHQALNIFSQISPAAQTLQERFITELKPCLEGTADDSAFTTLLETVNSERLALEAKLQQGRDKLLEYNSCRPRVADRIVTAMVARDENQQLSDFITRFFSATNINYIEQNDTSVVIQPADDMLIDGLEIPEDGMTATFSRSHALCREDLAYMTPEHPLVQSIFEMVHRGSFGNTNVALLKSAVIPEGSLLVEVWFRVEAIAPKVLNLGASLPQQLVRVLLGEKGKNLSEKIQPAMLEPLVYRLDRAKARQVIKARAEVISKQYDNALKIAEEKIAGFSEVAQQRFSKHLQYEIDRLTHLQAINPSIRQDEIDRLIRQKQDGLAHLENLSLVPDAIRVLVAVKP